MAPVAVEIGAAHCSGGRTRHDIGNLYILVQKLAQKNALSCLSVRVLHNAETEKYLRHCSYLRLRVLAHETRTVPIRSIIIMQQKDSEMAGIGEKTNTTVHKGWCYAS